MTAPVIPTTRTEPHTCAATPPPFASSRLVAPASTPTPAHHNWQTGIRGWATATALGLTTGISTTVAIGSISMMLTDTIDDEILVIFLFLAAIGLALAVGLAVYIVVGAVYIWRRVEPDRRALVGIAYGALPIIAGFVWFIHGILSA